MKRWADSMVIVPVGLDLGPVHVEDAQDAGPQYYEVHVGGTAEQLSAVEHLVWSGAFAEPEAQLDLKVDRQRLVEQLRQRVADPVPVVADLLERGLLLEYEPTAGEGLVDVFSQYRLFPRALGLGSTVRLPHMYGIGYGVNRFAEVPANVYHVWSFGIAMPTLWSACAQLADGADAGLAEGQQPFRLTPGEVAGQVAENLPLLVSTRAAFLDPLNYEPPRLAAPRELPAGDTWRAQLSRPVIVPVGISLGWDYWYGDPEQRAKGYFQVHQGLAYVDLDRAELAAWMGAFADLGRHAALEVTRETLARDLTARGMPDAASVVGRLIERGLLVEFDPVAGPLHELFDAVRLYPLGDGLGNTPDQPDMFRLGVGGEELLSVDPVSHAVWSRGMTDATLWQACATLVSSMNEQLAAQEGAAVSVDEVAREVAGALPALVAAGCAYIDPLNYAL